MIESRTAPHPEDIEDASNGETRRKRRQPRTRHRLHARDKVTLAVVIGCHGIGGEVRLKGLLPRISRPIRANDGALSLKSTRAGNNSTIALRRVADRNAAGRCARTELTVRSSLPPLEDGEYYQHDTVGLAAVDRWRGDRARRCDRPEFRRGRVIEIEAACRGRSRQAVHGADTRRAVPEWDSGATPGRGVFRYRIGPGGFLFSREGGSSLESPPARGHIVARSSPDQALFRRHVADRRRSHPILAHRVADLVEPLDDIAAADSPGIDVR